MRFGARMVAVGAVVLAFNSAVHAQGVLSADVIKQSFAGNTAEFVGPVNALAVFWAADGTQKMQTKSSTDSGTWRITPEGDFCGKWTKLRNGAESCAPVIDVGGGVFQWGNAKFRILLGNPKGL